MNIADRFYDWTLDDGSRVYGRLDTLPHLTLLALANQLMRDRRQREARTLTPCFPWPSPP